MQLTCYLSIVLIMISEFIPCMSCELSHLAFCMRFEVRGTYKYQTNRLLVRVLWCLVLSPCEYTLILLVWPVVSRAGEL